MPYHQALDDLLAGERETALRQAIQEVTARYRSAERTGARLVNARVQALSYAAARMDATRAAAFAALTALKGRAADFAPATLLDVGAGTGAATFAAQDVFPCLSSFACAEREEAMAQVGRALLPQAEWIRADITDGAQLPRADLVITAYVINELSAPKRAQALERLWDAALEALVIVEPGTKAGFANILMAREILCGRGAHIAAPCPQGGGCPLTADDWCHFTRRVARTRLQKYLKGGDAPYEDEHFSYLCLTRTPCAPAPARVLRHPQIRPGHIALTLCTPEGVRVQIAGKKKKEAFRAAKDASSGDEWTAE